MRKPWNRSIRMLLLPVAALLCAAKLSAQSTFVTFSVDMSTNITLGNFIPGTDTVSVHGTFNGWGAGVNLVQEGASTVYTNTVNDTSDANGGVMDYKFVNSDSAQGNGGYESLASGYNRSAKLPATSGASLVLPTPIFGDLGAAVTNEITFQVDMSEQVNLGNFTNGAGTVQVNGLFNGWSGASYQLTNDPSIIVTNEPSGVVTTDVYVGTFQIANSPAAVEQFKFVMNGTAYESVSAANSDPNSGNRIFANVPQTLPVVFFSDSPLAPSCLCQFSVDMTIVQFTDTNFYAPSLTINGTMNGWGGTTLTNNPNAANTNIYTSPFFPLGVNSSQQYQFRYTEGNGGPTTYDHANGAYGGQGNRLLTVPNLVSTNISAVFNDARFSDYLLNPTPVLFSVNMANAVGTDGHTFNPAADNVYINGAFAGWYPWAGGVNPTPAPPGYQMIQEGTSSIYTNTLMIPAGTTVDCVYKYGMDPNGANGGPDDDEAGIGLNHARVIRSFAQSPYAMATDTFGNQYNEPYFSPVNLSGGDLAVGRVSNGKVPVQWLGTPGTRLAWSSSLSPGVWQQVVPTDGTNWSLGYGSTNGFVSETNFPATGGQLYFRLAKPY
jgi:hypothetical protein